VATARGLYHPKWGSEPAWIELHIDSVFRIFPKYLLKFKLSRELELGATFFHELRPSHSRATSSRVQREGRCRGTMEAHWTTQLFANTVLVFLSANRDHQAGGSTIRFSGSPQKQDTEEQGCACEVKGESAITGYT
jgi:hypothetical protein